MKLEDLDRLIEELESWAGGIRQMPELAADCQRLTQAATTLRSMGEELEALRELYKKADKDATSNADQNMRLREQLEEARATPCGVCGELLCEDSQKHVTNAWLTLESERDRYKAALEKVKGARRVTEKQRRYDKKYHESEKGKSAARRYNQSEQGKATRRKINKKYCASEKGKAARRRYAKDNREKIKARNALANAVSMGKLTKPPSKAGHHWDYYRPFDLRWLDQATHLELHEWCKKFKAYYENL